MTEIGPFRITTAPVNHPVEAYGYAGRGRRRSLVFSGDTGECDALVELARGADLALFEASFLDRLRRPAAEPAPDRPRRRPSTPTRAGVGRLVLTHLVPWTPRDETVAEARRCSTATLELADPGARAVDDLSRAGVRRGRARRLAAHDPHPTAAPPTSSVPSRSSAAGSTTPRARASSSSAAPACCAPPRSPPGVPRWRKDSGLGWVTGEYAMLPRATNTRNDRESVRGKVGGRTHEISRLVGRSLRAVIDLSALGENTIVIDCDVLQADGGTRTAAITGAYVALVDAIELGARQGPREGRRAARSRTRSRRSASASSTASRASTCTTTRTSRADTDMNVVMTGDGRYVEVQGTAEGEPFDRALLDELLDLAAAGCAELTRLQIEALARRDR